MASSRNRKRNTGTERVADAGFKKRFMQSSNSGSAKW